MRALSRLGRAVVRRLEPYLPVSLVGRTSVLIIAIALLVSALFSTVAAFLTYDYEEGRYQNRMSELLSTIESTVRIACYVRDVALAKEITAGLLRNGGVEGVQIVADGQVLYEKMPPMVPGASKPITVSRTIHSPFNAEERVGEVHLFVSRSDISAQAWSYTRFLVLMLTAQGALIALSVAWIVYNLVTRPIKQISDALHVVNVVEPGRFEAPPGHERNEIGRLVYAGNKMFAKLSRLIAAERELRLQQEQSERRLSLIFQKADTGLFEIDRDGHLHTCNPAFRRILGGEVESDNLLDWLPEHRSIIDDLAGAALRLNKTQDQDLEVLSTDAEGSFWVNLSLTPVEEGRLQGVVIDITERKKAELSAQQLASRDPLTGLYNRRGFEQGLGQALKRMRQEPELKVALLLVDLDLFKQVNDTHGHDAGDIVLQRVAEILEQAVRRSDIVARYGGDEFAIVLIGIDDISKAERVAHQIISQAQLPVDLQNGHFARIGASAGIALSAGSEEPASALLRRADEALYAAKEAGRFCCRIAALPSQDEREEAVAAEDDQGAIYLM